MSEWQPIKTAPHDRYILLCDKNSPAWDGNMEVGKWFGDETTGRGCFWCCGGPNGGVELEGSGHFGHYDRFTHWMDLPEQPK